MMIFKVICKKIKKFYVFKIDLASAVGLLSFLGIPDDKIKEVYLQLISFKEYKSTNDKQYNLYER